MLDLYGVFGDEPPEIVMEAARRVALVMECETVPDGDARWWMRRGVWRVDVELCAFVSAWDVASYEYFGDVDVMRSPTGFSMVEYDVYDDMRYTAENAVIDRMRSALVVVRSEWMRLALAG